MSALPKQHYDVGPSRLEAVEPRTYRIAFYPDGSKRVQGGYAWSQGKNGGLAWRDLPLVQVDADGQEVK